MITLLSGEHGSRFMRQIKSALALKLRPSAHILALKNPHSNWKRIDHVLAVAFAQLESEICDKCGNPIWVCRTDDERVGFKVETYRCWGDAELEKARKSREGKKGKSASLKPGEYEYVVPYTYDKGPLPTREDFYSSMIVSE